MTYGWALLVVLVAIGALAFFGVLNPGQFLPSSCTITPGISCDDFTASASQVQVVLRNGMGDSLTSVALIVDGASCSQTGTAGTISDGDAETFTCAGGWTKGDKLKADLALTYKVGSSTISHTKIGQLVTQVE